jgi:hypothetical protein
LIVPGRVNSRISSVEDQPMFGQLRDGVEHLAKVRAVMVSAVRVPTSG